MKRLLTLAVTTLTLPMMTMAQDHAGHFGVVVNPEAITVSGISAGAAMAQQLHLAYPELFSGAGLIAGVPRGCAQGSLQTAMASCMAQAGASLDVDHLADQLRQAASAGQAGDPALLADDRAWVFHGSGDVAIAEAVTRAAADLYRPFMAQDRIRWVADVQTAHTFPTLDQGTPCDEMTSPFIGACDYDAAGELLGHLYPDLAPPATNHAAELTETPLPGAGAAGLAETALVYRPESCPAEGCRLHLVLHGCGQSTEQIGPVFAETAGYLRWAAATTSSWPSPR